MRIISKLSFAAISIVALAATGTQTFALSAHATTKASLTTEQSSTTTTDDSSAADTQNKSANRSALAQEKLTAVKLKVCQNREKAIQKILTKIADRGQKQLDLFTT